MREFEKEILIKKFNKKDFENKKKILKAERSRSFSKTKCSFNAKLKLNGKLTLRILTIGNAIDKINELIKNKKNIEENKKDLKILKKRYIVLLKKLNFEKNEIYVFKN